MTYELCVDWDATDWTATPDFTAGIDDISAYMKRFSTKRGKDKELGNAPAGTLEITLNNSDKRFSPVYASSPLYGKIRPWLPVRLRVTYGVTTVTLYTGFISRLTIYPLSKKQEAYLYCTDGTDLLARNMVTQAEDNREPMTDGAALGKVLDASGWPSGKRAIDTDGGNIVKYPVTVEF